MTNFLRIASVCLAALCLVFTACKKDDPQPNDNDPDPIVENNKFETIDCFTVFESGDYSDLCSVSGPDILWTSAGVAGEAEDCFIVTATESNEDLYGVIIEISNSVDNAKEFFQAYQYSSIFSTGVNLVSTSISNVGDEAQLYEYEEEDERMHHYMVVRESNAAFVIFTSYELDETPSCTYDKDQMAIFAREMLSNL